MPRWKSAGLSERVPHDRPEMLSAAMGACADRGPGGDPRAGIPMTARDLANRLGLKRSGRAWRGTCPACGYPGTLSVREGRGGRPLYWCASCQDRAALARALSSGVVAYPPVGDSEREAEAKARKQDRAVALWNGSNAADGTCVASYLGRRGLDCLIGCPELRYRGDTPHPAGGRLPAMIARVVDATGTMVAIHRTYLTRDGTKAKADPPKASLGPAWGGAIRLSPHDPDRRLVIAEGIETAASAARLLRLPAWAAISAGNMAKGLVLPPEVRRVCIAADPDEPGRRAARDAWFRWRSEGRDVTIVTPNGTGDFNDILCRSSDHVG